VADLRRHLENEPVVARPPSTAYRLQKPFGDTKLVICRRSGGFSRFDCRFGFGHRYVFSGARSQKRVGGASNRSAVRQRTAETQRQRAEKEWKRAEDNV